MEEGGSCDIITEKYSILCIKYYFLHARNSSNSRVINANYNLYFFAIILNKKNKEETYET